MKQEIVCQSWCEGKHDSPGSECESNFTLFDQKDYVAEVQDGTLDPALAEMRELFSAVGATPPEAEWVNLFALHDSESGTIETAMQLQTSASGAIEPAAVAVMTLQGLKDFYERVGRVIDTLEG